MPICKPNELYETIPQLSRIAGLDVGSTTVSIAISDPHLTIATAKKDDTVEIRIADTGTGITDEMKKRLFEPFATSKEDGMGIGLSLSKSIVEAHKGEIYAKDNHPAGTVFLVALPAAKDDA